MAKPAVMTTTDHPTLAELRDLTPEMLARTREPAVFETFTAALTQHRKLLAERTALDRRLDHASDEDDEAREITLVRLPQLRIEQLAAGRALKAARTAKEQAVARARQWVDEVTYEPQLDVAQVAKQQALERVAQSQHRRAETQLEIDRRRELSLVANGDDTTRFGQVAPERLLDQHAAAHWQRRHDTFDCLGRHRHVEHGSGLGRCFRQ